MGNVRESMCNSTRRRFGDQTRNSQRSGAMSVAPSLLLARLIHQEDSTERRQGQSHGPSAAVERNRCGIDTAHIPLPASAVERSIAVEDLPPVSGGGNT